MSRADYKRPAGSWAPDRNGNVGDRVPVGPPAPKAEPLEIFGVPKPPNAMQKPVAEIARPADERYRTDSGAY
jgi:hypothetical protein